MNRGSMRRPLVTFSIRSSFNEAPIHESGKYVELRSVKGHVLGFNEAPIHESGK